MLSYFKYFIRTILLPIRLVWSPFIYPLQLAFQKTSINPISKSIIFEDRYPASLFIYVPGRDEITFESHPFSTTETNLEIMPPPSYSTLKPFSIGGWADAINNRISSYKECYPDAQICVFGQSMGGAATGLAFSKKSFPNVKYAIINSFNSLPELLWLQPGIEITILMAHIIAVALFMITISQLSCSRIFITGIILGSCSVFILLSSQAYMRIIQSGALIHWNRFWDCIYKVRLLPRLLGKEINRTFRTYENRCLNWLSSIPIFLYKTSLLIFLILITATYYSLIIPLNILHIVSHFFVVMLLWTMDSHHNIGKALSSVPPSLPTSLYVFQSNLDSVIPARARLSRHVEHTQELEDDAEHSKYDCASIIAQVHNT